MSTAQGYVRKWRASVALNGGTAVTIKAPKNALCTVNVTHMALSITTHAAFAVTIRDTTPTSIAVHTDAVAAAGVPSVVTWDFGADEKGQVGSNGLALGVGKSLECIANAGGPVGFVYAEGYEIIPPSSL